jgi:hypothetical protein
MFERSFAWTMRHGSRLLFAAAIVMLLAGIVGLWSITRDSGFANPQPGFLSLLSHLLYTSFAPAAYLLFGAVLTERFRRD